MSKVYVVRYGEYSDQGISGVFSTREKAEKYCKIYNEIEDSWCGDYWVDEYELDEDEIKGDPKIVTYYCMDVQLEDEWNYNNTKITYHKGEVTDNGTEKNFYSKDVIINKWSTYAEIKSVISPEHARKVAEEQYQIYTQQKMEDGKI